MEQVIREIAERIGLEAARVWPQVVAVTWVTSLFWTVADPLIIVVAVVGIVATWRRVAAEQQTAKAEATERAKQRGTYLSTFDYDCMGWQMIGVAVTIVCLFVVIAAFTSWPDQLAGTLYPEATTVLHLAKGAK